MGQDPVLLAVLGALSDASEEIGELLKLRPIRLGFGSGRMVELADQMSVSLLSPRRTRRMVPAN